jgi:hypothetical protein
MSTLLAWLRLPFDRCRADGHRIFTKQGYDLCRKHGSLSPPSAAAPCARCEDLQREITRLRRALNDPEFRLLESLRYQRRNAPMGLGR